MPVLGTEYIHSDQVERDFYSTRQDYAHSQQEVVTEERYFHPNSQEVSLSTKSLRGELLGELMTETAHPGQAL